jgi:hypothetical protein
MNDTTTSEPDTAGSTRRGFLLSAGAGAAGAAALGTLGRGETTSTPPSVPAGSHSPLVAYVRDARSGDVVVMVDDHEYVVHDPDLAARIARAAR